MEKVMQLLINNGFTLEASSPDSALFTQGELMINIFQDSPNSFTLIKDFGNDYVETNHEFCFEDIEFEIEG